MSSSRDQRLRQHGLSGGVQAIERIIEDDQAGSLQQRAQQQDLARFAGRQEAITAWPERFELERRKQRVLASGVSQQLADRRARVDGVLKVALVGGQLGFVERLLRLRRQELNARKLCRERTRRPRFA